jgi:hypothetical protein
VIVESPAKAKTLNKYLGPDYVVMASVGHVRDLPGKNPKGVKDPVPGVDLDRGFKPSYEIIKGKAATVAHLRQAAKKADGIWLATDMDREGEAIAWHLVEALKIPPEKAKRVVFNAITKSEDPESLPEPKEDRHEQSQRPAGQAGSGQNCGLSGLTPSLEKSGRRAQRGPGPVRGRAPGGGKGTGDRSLCSRGVLEDLGYFTVRPEMQAALWRKLDLMACRTSKGEERKKIERPHRVREKPLAFRT